MARIVWIRLESILTYVGKTFTVSPRVDYYEHLLILSVIGTIVHLLKCEDKCRT